MDQNDNFGPEELGTNPPDETPPSPMTTQQIRSTSAKEVAQMRTDATTIGRPPDERQEAQQSQQPPPQLPAVRKNEAQPKPTTAGTVQGPDDRAQQTLAPPTVQNPVFGNSAAPILKDPEQGWSLTQMAARVWSSLLAPGAVRDSAFQADNDDWIRSKFSQAIGASRKSDAPLWYQAADLATRLGQQYPGDPGAIVWAGLSSLLLNGHQDPAVDAAIEQHVPGWTQASLKFSQALQAAKQDRSSEAPGGFNLGNAAAAAGHLLWMLNPFLRGPGSSANPGPQNQPAASASTGKVINLGPPPVHNGQAPAQPESGFLAQDQALLQNVRAAANRPGQGPNIGGALGNLGNFLWQYGPVQAAKQPGRLADVANQVMAAPFVGVARDYASITAPHDPASQQAAQQQVLDAFAGFSLLGAGEASGGLTALDSIRAGKGMVGDLTRAKLAQAAEFANPSRVVYAMHDADLSKLPPGPPIDPLAEAAQIARVPNETVRAEGAKAADIARRQGVTLSPGDIFEANLGKEVREKFGVNNMAELVQKVKEDHMTPEEVKWLSSPQRWNHDFTYPLVRTGPEDVPRTNPWQHIDALPADLKKQGVQMNLQAERFIHAIDAGPMYSEDLNAVPGSMVRSIGGIHESTDASFATVEAAANRLVKGLSDEHFQNMRRVMEGRTDLMPTLPPNAQQLVSVSRNIDAVLRQHYAETGYPKEATPNYFPRKEVALTDKGRPSPGGGLLTGEGKAHRQEVFVADPKGQLHLEERFKNIDALNAERARQRRETVQRLVNGDPERGTEPMDPKDARRNAAILHPPFQGDWRIWLKDVQRRVNAFHAWQAKEEALNAKIGERDENGQHMNMAYDRNAMTENEKRLTDANGYRQVNFGAFDNIIWHPKAAKLLERVNALRAKERTPFGSAIQDINNEAKGLILYSPLMHATNIAGSLGAFVTAGLTHPGMMTRHLVEAVQHSKTAELLGSLGTTPEARLQSVKDAARYHDARKAAYFEAGGVIPRKAKWASPSAASWAYGSGDVDMAGHYGSQDIEGAPMTLQTSPLRNALDVGAATYGGYKALGQFVYNRYVDLATWAHAFEHERLMAEGESWNAARLRAADSASAWMGQIRPERWTPYAKANSALGFLAPNWWRSRAEILLPLYDRAGLDTNPGRARMDVVNTVRAAAAIAGFSFVSGNLLNYLASGHWQNQNQPGNRNLLEWDRLYPPGADGRHYVSTNALARPTRDVEKLFNVDYRSQNPILEFLNDKSGPLVQAVNRAANIDLHQSLHDGQLVHIDPGNPTEFSPAALAAAVASFLPGGQSIASAIEGTAQDKSLGPYSTRIPKSVLDRAGQFVNNAAFGLFGLNAPYAHQEQGPGIPVSGDVWYAVNQRQTQYAQAQAKLSDALLSGAMSPTEWYANYKRESDAYHQFLTDTFKNAPYYTDGPLGLYHEWSSLYDKAKDQYGQIDWARYDELTAQFEANHTQAQMDALNQQRAKSELQIPALKLFRDTNNAYRTFQENTALQLGIPVSELRATLSQESQVFNDRQALQRLEGQHPELRSYAQAKARWETGSLAGLLYGMFYDSSTVLNWMAVHGMSKEQVLTTAEQAEQAAATG